VAVSVSGFDVVAHHRERTREAERQADMLARELDKAVRLLALAVRAAAGDEADPATVLRVLEELDGLVQRPEPTVDDLIALFRETDPDRGVS
jgi:hypothetical protein